MSRRQTNLAPAAGRPWLAGAALALLAVLAHAPGIPGDFLWDDEYWIWGNPVAQAGSAPAGYWWTTATLDYLPVTFSFFHLQHRLWGDRPVGDPQVPYPALPYRAVNVACHAAAAVLVWRVLAALALPGAWLGAALFAVHPVTVASSGWVSETKNTLSLIFYALALLAYLRFDSTGRWRFYAACLAAFVLALLTKTSTVVLPAVLVVLLWRRRRPLRTARAVLPLASLFLLAAAAGAGTLWFHTHVGALSLTQGLGPPRGPWQRLLTAAKALWFYAFTAAAPVRLSLIYPKWDLSRLDWTALAVPALAGWAALLAVLRRRAWARPAAAASACFALSLAPVLGLVDMTFMQFSFVSDHLAYLALPVLTASAAAVAATAIRRGGRWRPAVTAAAAAALALLAAMTAGRAHTFARATRLWDDVTRRNPAMWQARGLYGEELFKAGRTEAALEQLHRALALRGDSAWVRGDMALVYEQRQDYASADRYYAEAIERDPANAKYRYLRGRLLVQLGRPGEAVVQLERAVAARPDWPEPHFELAAALSDTGRADQAAWHYRRVIELKGEHAAAMHNLAWLLATAEDDTLRDPGEALRLAERVGQLGTADPLSLHMLRSAALAELGRPDEAVAAARAALAEARGRGQEQTAANIRGLIEHYQRGLNFRDYQQPRP